MNGPGLPAHVRLTPLAEQVFAVLERYTAFPWPVLSTQCKRANVDPAALGPDGLRQFIPLLEAGVQLLEYQPAMMHGKAMVVDGRWCTFGSTNFDPRSFFLNSELNVSIDDQAIAAQFEAFFERAMADSARVELEAWRQRPLVDKLIGLIGKLVQDQL